MIDLSRLLCALDGHVAETGETWNRGYAFSRCRRCEREIVRSLFGRWRLPPRGYRVVWRRPDTPADARRRPLSRHAARGNEASPFGDFMDDGGPDFRWTADPPPPDPIASPGRSDFMHDDPVPPPRVRERG